VDNNLTGLRKKISQKRLKLAVVGLGYVGFPLALEFAKKKVKVIGIEIDAGRLHSILQRKSYISDISNQELKKALSGGYFCASSSFTQVRQADAVLICVPTPLKGKYLPDISFIKNAVSQVALNLKKGALVILESTTYPGTTDEVILPLLESGGLRHGEDFYLCFSPERIDPGNSKYPLSKIPKVIGGVNKEAGLLGKAVYEIIVNKVVIVSSTRVAEITKLLENTFRIVNIGLIDELAMMAHKMKIDIWEVIDAAATKPFGFMPFYPGPGVGGHCIPKDPLYLYWKARKFGFKSRFIKLASDVISYMPGYVVKRLAEALKAEGLEVKGSNILLIGLTYKKDVKDLRKSPSLDIFEILKKERARVSYHDPLIPYLKFAELNFKSLPLTQANLHKFDCVVIATDHSKIDYNLILRSAKMVFDARNIYKGKAERKIIKL